MFLINKIPNSTRFNIMSPFMVFAVHHQNKCCTYIKYDDVEFGILLLLAPLEFMLHLCGFLTLSLTFKEKDFLHKCFQSFHHSHFSSNVLGYCTAIIVNPRHFMLRTIVCDLDIFICVYHAMPVLLCFLFLNKT